MADENPMDQGPAVPPQPAEKAKHGATHACKAAEDLQSDVGATADEYRAHGKEVWDDALHRVRSFQDDSKQYVRENPTKAVFTALGVGFVMGLIFRREGRSPKDSKFVTAKSTSASETYGKELRINRSKIGDPIK
jgi:ElaB/YqjD/DUF883 family membrane-anchored ribosome-binding protein